MVNVPKIYKIEHITAKGKKLKYELTVLELIAANYSTDVELVYISNNTRQLIAEFEKLHDPKEAFSISMERLFTHAETLQD